MKIRKRIIVFICSILLLTNCKDDNSDFIIPITHNFKVIYKEYPKICCKKAQIVLKNNEDGKVYKAFTDSTGYAKIELIPGVYQANVTQTLTNKEYEATFGQKTERANIIFNGSVENLKITQSTEMETNLELVTGKIGNLIFKQIYYSGSHARLGAYLRDQFFEVHNNSNQTLYLDGFYIAQLRGINTKRSRPEKYDYLSPSGQYDWSKSIGQKHPETANTDYVYAFNVLQFPGNGTEHPLLPGKSAIVAATAVNHQAPLTVTEEDGTKKTYKVPEPWRTVDLSNAAFECYYKPYQQSVGQDFLDWDIDNPKVPNMKIIFKHNSDKDFTIDFNGHGALIIFKVSKEDFDKYDCVPTPVDKTFQYEHAYKQIPKNVIIDGVEMKVNEGLPQTVKKLPDDIDAGATEVPNGAFSSQSVIRKISSQKDGKVFYQDTNNSTNDFKVLNHPQVDAE